MSAETLSHQETPPQSNQQGTQQEPGNSCSASSTDCNGPYGIFKKPVLRALDLCKAPADTWKKIKDEPLLVSDIYAQYIIPVVLVTSIAGFLGFWLVGFPIPFVGRIGLGFFGSFWKALVTLAAGLACPFIAAKVFSLLAPKFNVKLDEISALKLIAFAMLPAMIAQVTYLIPGILVSLFIFATSIYGIYLFLVGVDILAEVPSDKKWPFIGAGVLCTFVVNIVLFLIVGLITPTPQVDFKFRQNITIPGVGEVNPEQMNKVLDQYQKSLPK